MTEFLWRRSTRQALSLAAPAAGVVYWAARTGASGRTVGLSICLVLLVGSIVVNAVIFARTR